MYIRAMSTSSGCAPLHLIVAGLAAVCAMQTPAAIAQSTGAIAQTPAAIAQARVAAVPALEAMQPNGAADFDFERGEWRVRHRMKPAGQDAWIEFSGTCRMRTLIDGSVNVEEHTFVRPGGVTFGIALRTYEPKTRLWAIWWVDSRDPHGALDPPLKGRFVDGVGTFYSDYIADGKPMRTRFVWSHPTANAARWEQANSADAGATWDTNWIMEFERVT